MFLYPPALSDWLKNLMLLSDPIRIEVNINPININLDIGNREALVGGRKGS